MALNKNDQTSDGIADLYRASYYLAKQSKDVGLMFLKRSKAKLGPKMILDFGFINKENVLRKSTDFNFWAEKVLDEYKRLKMSLS